MMRKLLAFALFSIAARAQDAIQPPAGVHTLYTTIGVGVQIYTCAPSGNWTLQEPQAQIFDLESKQQVGQHTKGPTWTWNDGSAITGKVLQQKPSPDSIPWLLLEAHSIGAAGSLSSVAYVRRSDTQGGKVPTDAICGGNNQGELLRVPYQATYTFYTAK